MLAMSPAVGDTGSRSAPGADGCNTSRCATSLALGDVPRSTSLRPRVVTAAEDSALTRTRNCGYVSSPRSTTPFRTGPNFTALSSESVWTRSHRVGGYAKVVAGIITIVAGVVARPAGYIVALASLLMSGLVPVVYSYIVWSSGKGGT